MYYYKNKFKKGKPELSSWQQKQQAVGKYS